MQEVDEICRRPQAELVSAHNLTLLTTSGRVAKQPLTRVRSAQTATRLEVGLENFSKGSTRAPLGSYCRDRGKEKGEVVEEPGVE